VGTGDAAILVEVKQQFHVATPFAAGSKLEALPLAVHKKRVVNELPELVLYAPDAEPAPIGGKLTRARQRFDAEPGLHQTSILHFAGKFDSISYIRWGVTLMRKTIPVLLACWPDIHMPEWQGRRLRGFFAAGQGEGSLLHNHGERGQGLYRYPLVQYKVIDGIPTVLAAAEGIQELLPLVTGCQELALGNRSYPRGTLQLSLTDQEVGDADAPVRYRFRTPWFGLNQENYRVYESAGQDERQALLDRVLAGNLLSLSKGLGVTVEVRLRVESALRPERVSFKGETVLGFTGEFSANFILPELMGLGKSVSRGFGAVGTA